MKTRSSYLYERMIEEGITLEELSEKSGLTTVTIKTINNKRPSVSTLIKLGIALNQNDFVEKMRELPGKEAENKN